MVIHRTGSAYPGYAVTILLLALLLQALPPAFAAAGPAGDWAAWYERSLEWQADATPRPIPPEGVRITRDGFELLLEAGEARPLVPGPDGVFTGLVFEGRGRLRLPVPDR